MKRRYMWLVGVGAGLLALCAVITMKSPSLSCKSIADEAAMMCRKSKEMGDTPDSLKEQVQLLGNGGAVWGSNSGSAILIYHYRWFDVKTPGCIIRLSFKVENGKVEGSCEAWESF